MTDVALAPGHENCWAAPQSHPPVHPVAPLKVRDFGRHGLENSPIQSVLGARKIQGSSGRKVPSIPVSLQSPTAHQNAVRGTNQNFGEGVYALAPKVKDKGGNGSCDCFINVLVESGIGTLDPTVLAKLEVEAATSRRLVEVVRLLRTIKAQIDDVPSCAADRRDGEHVLDISQMAAQVAYLDRKILKLREKLKRREKNAPKTKISPNNPATVDLEKATIGEMFKEVVALRNRKNELKKTALRSDTICTNKVRRPTKDAAGNRQVIEDKDVLVSLKRRWSTLQDQMLDIAAEKATANENAKKARELAVQVEARLRDMASARDCERTRMEDEQRLLQKRCEESLSRLAEAKSRFGDLFRNHGLDAETGADHRNGTDDNIDNPPVIEPLRRKIVEVDKLIANENQRGVSTFREPAESPNSLIDYECSEGGGCWRSDSIGRRPESSISSTYLEELSRPVSTYTEEQLNQAKFCSEREIENLARTSALLLAAENAMLGELEANILKRKSDADAQELARRRELAEQAERQMEVVSQARSRTSSKIDQEQVLACTEKQMELHPRSTATAVEEERFRMASLEADILAKKSDAKSAELARRKKLAEEAECQMDAAIQTRAGSSGASVQAALSQLKSALANLEEENCSRQDHHNGLLRHHCDLRGRVILAFRAANYGRVVVQHYLGLVLGIPGSTFVIAEESSLPPHVKSSQWLEVSGEPLPDEEPLMSCTRPLPEPDEKKTKAVGQAKAAEHVSKTDRYLDPDAFVRIVVDVRPGESSSVSTSGPEIAYRLAEIVRAGGSLLEDLGVIGACCLRGSCGFEDASAWSVHDAELLFRTRCTISSKTMVISGYCSKDRKPLAIKLVQSKLEDLGYELPSALCLNAPDLLAICQGNLKLDQDMFDTIVKSLRLVQTSTTRPATLVAQQWVLAPRTVLNSGECRPMAELRDSPCGADTVLRSDDVPHVQRKNEAEPSLFVEAGLCSATLHEGVLDFGDALLLLNVSARSCGTILLNIQDTGSESKFFQMVLPGRGSAQQLRATVNTIDHGEHALQISAEDVISPDGVVIRISRSNRRARLAWTDSLQHVVWLSSKQVRDPLAEAAAVSVIPSFHRQRLLDFALGNRISLCPSDSGTGHLIGGSGDHMLETLKQSIGCNSTDITDQLIATSTQATGRSLLQMGCRIPAPKDETILCVFTVKENAEPYAHLVILAHEVGRCRSWSLLVTSLDIFPALHRRFDLGNMELASRKSLAKEIVEHLALSSKDCARNFKLVLAGSDDAVAQMEGAGPRSSTPSRSSLLSRSGVQISNSASAQLLTQGQAAAYVADENRFCLLQASRRLGSTNVDIIIFEEPEAPEAAFNLNNLLVIGFDAARGFYYSIRLNDDSLRSALAKESDGSDELLEPLLNRSALLQRLICNLDLVHLGSSESNRLVLQSHCTGEIGVLALDGTGIFRPRKDQPAEALLALGDAAGRHGGNPVDEHYGQQLLPITEESALQDCSDEICIGAFLFDMTSFNVQGAPLLAERVGKLGGVDFRLTLQEDLNIRCQTLTLFSAADPPTTCEIEKGLVMQLPSAGAQNMWYLEHRCLCGLPVVAALFKQSFPHEVQASILDPKSQEELCLTASDDAIFPFIERSLRDRLSFCVEQLVKFGALPQVAGVRQSNCGHEIIPVDPRDRALQQSIILVHANISSEADYFFDDEFCPLTEMIFSCVRYVVAPQSEDGAIDIDSVPVLKLSLSKQKHGQEFALSIERESVKEGVTVVEPENKRILRVRDKRISEPLGLYAEICEIGDLRLLVFFLDDNAPRSLRLAVVDPCSGWQFQLIVFDSACPENSRNVQLVPAPSPKRHQLLQAFRRHWSTKNDTAADCEIFLRQLPAAGELEDGQKALLHHYVLRRETRFPNDDSEEVVLVTVSCEGTETGPFVLKVTLSQPTSAKETQLLLVNPILDMLLLSCNLPESEELQGPAWIDLFNQPEVRASVGAMAMKITSVTASFELDVCAGKCPDAVTGKSGGPGTIATESPFAASACPECLEERLLGRIEVATDEVGSSSLQEQSPREDQTSDKTLGRCVEVFEGCDCVQALFHSTNLLVRVKEVTDGRMAVRNFHENDLEDWLERAGLSDLLLASRETDLVKALLEHARLVETGSADSIIFKEMSPDFCRNFHADLPSEPSP